MSPTTETAISPKLEAGPFFKSFQKAGPTCLPIANSFLLHTPYVFSADVCRTMIATLSAEALLTLARTMTSRTLYYLNSSIVAFNSRTPSVNFIFFESGSGVEASTSLTHFSGAIAS